MAEVDGACKLGRYETIWLNSLRVMPNVEVLGMKDGQQAEHGSLLIVSNGSKIVQGFSRLLFPEANCHKLDVPNTGETLITNYNKQSCMFSSDSSSRTRAGSF